MRRIYRYLAIAVIALASLLGMMSIANASVAPPAPPAPPAPVVSVEDPGVIEQFGPPGVIITTVLTGVLMIVRSINEGKKIDVTTYKERASEAETRSNEEIGKVHKKLRELEDKLDVVIADRDEYRNTLEDRKAEYTQQIISMEKRHQRELEDMHAALVSEIHVRHKLERILAQHNIGIPETPPPYSKKMRDAATDEEEEEASRVINSTSVNHPPDDD